MQEVCTIGLDIAKSVFQAHGVDGAGNTVIRKPLPRSKVLTFFAEPPGLMGIEACPTAHHVSRDLTRLGYRVGHRQSVDLAVGFDPYRDFCDLHYADHQ